MGLFEALEKPEDIDARVRSRLAGSLDHIIARASGHLDVDANQFETALDQIREYRQNPGVFTRYYDLVFAVKSNQFTLANQLVAEIIERAGQPIEFAILPYDREHLGEDYDRFANLLFGEFSGTNPMARPADAIYSARTENLQLAIDIVSQVDKSIHDEITGLLTRIFVTTGNTGQSVRFYGGVTSFMVWGASFINADAYRSPWEAVQFLVHEITHSVLFGLSCDEPLVLNDPADSFGSPLRSDQRPMDGIYHAMVVCARLVIFNRMWLDSSLVSPEDRDAIEKTTRIHAGQFRDGVAVINRHGVLSEQGRHLFDSSCRALAEAA